MERVVLIDADSLLYKGIEDLGEYKDRIDTIISDIITETDSSHYRVFLEAPKSKSFRKLLNTTYKKNRKGRPLPINFVEIKQYIMEEYNAYLSYLEETDDSVVSTHNYLKKEYPFTDVIIAANDKDYKTKEVVYYDLYHGRFGEISEISEEEAKFNFYKQMLMGDSADNVGGVKGIGSKGADKILKPSKDYFISTYRTYVSRFGSDARDKWNKNMNMLYLREDVRPCVEFSEVSFDG